MAAMHRRCSILLLSVLFILLLSAAVLFAGGKPADQPVTFGLYEFGTFYDARTDTGIDKDAALELSRRSGRSFHFRILPRARIWAELERGTLMMSGSGIETPDRSSFAWFVHCMEVKNLVIILKSVKASNAGEFIGNRSLLWGAVRSFKHGKDSDAFLCRLREQQREIKEADLMALYKLMKAGRIQAVFSHAPAYTKYLKDYGLEDQVRIENWFPSEKPVATGIVFSKKTFSNEEMTFWRTIIEGMKKDGTLKRIYARHLGELEAERMIANIKD